jgi:hypothetical protein
MPPPLPIGKSEFEKRIRAGARTIAEIDPELWKWKQNCEFSHKIQAIILILGIVFFIITFLIFNIK